MLLLVRLEAAVAELGTVGREGGREGGREKRKEGGVSDENGTSRKGWRQQREGRGGGGGGKEGGREGGREGRDVPGIDELKVDLLEVRALGVGPQGLPKGDDTLLAPDHLALEHQPVLVDDTVVGEATQGGDALRKEGGRREGGREGRREGGVSKIH